MAQKMSMTAKRAYLQRNDILWFSGFRRAEPSRNDTSQRALSRWVGIRREKESSMNQNQQNPNQNQQGGQQKPGQQQGGGQKPGQQNQQPGQGGQQGGQGGQQGGQGGQSGNR
jgi:hypothetical protein